MFSWVFHLFLSDCLLWIFSMINHPDAQRRSGGWSADIRLTQCLYEARVCRNVSSYIQSLESFSCSRFRTAQDEEWRRLFRASYVTFPRLLACCDHQFQSVWRDINVHTCILIYINISVSAVNSSAQEDAVWAAALTTPCPQHHVCSSADKVQGTSSKVVYCVDWAKLKH